MGSRTFQGAGGGQQSSKKPLLGYGRAGWAGREGLLCPGAAQPEAAGAEDARPAGRQAVGRGPALSLRSSPPDQVSGNLNEGAA